MFVSKKHIARRTFLRGAGVTLALPLLESMLPALTPTRMTAAAPVRRFVGIWHPHGAAPGYWSPLKEGQGLRLLLHHEAARAIPQPRGPHQRPRHAGGDGDDGRAGRRSRARRGAAVRRAAATQRREPVPGHHHRSAHRQQIRAGHDPFVAAARRRGHGQLRQLQLGLQLRLHQLDLVVVAHAAAADAGQSARGVRAAVRRRHEPGRTAARTASATPAFSTRSSGSSVRSRATSARATRRASTPTSTTSASSSGASRSRWRTR